MPPLTDTDIKRLDERFVRRDVCDDHRAEMDKRQDATEIKVNVQGHQIATLIKVLMAIGAAIATPLIAIAIQRIFG